VHFPLTVKEIVMMGRYPHFQYQPSKKDVGICEQILHELDAWEFSERDYLTLSGGEKQRIQFARVLAQVWEAPAEGNRYLLLDEPISNVDMHYQHQFMQKLQLLKKEGIVVIAVLHDMNLALQYADRLLFMNHGKIVQQGATCSVVSASLIREVFQVSVQLIPNPAGHGLLMVYSGN
jgi:iron complex transport system ATP-binding protein